MKHVVILFSLLFLSSSAFAMGGAPCNRETFRRFLAEARSIQEIKDEKAFKVRWDSFATKANTELKDELRACGYDPQELRDVYHMNYTLPFLNSVLAQMCQGDASASRERDTDRCRKDFSDKAGRDFEKCVDRADRNFNTHLASCGVRDVFADRSFGNGGSSKCEGGSCSK